MTAKNEALQDWEVDFFWRRAADRWEWEQDNSPEVELLRAETEKEVLSTPMGPFITFHNMTEQQIVDFMRGGELA